MYEYLLGGKLPIYFNGGSIPLVPEGRWGEGVILPGERYETDSELGHPWVIDAETEAATNAAVLPTPDASATVPPDSSTEGVSVPASAPHDAVSGNDAGTPGTASNPNPQESN